MDLRSSWEPGSHLLEMSTTVMERDPGAEHTPRFHSVLQEEVEWEEDAGSGNKSQADRNGVCSQSHG